MKTVKVDFSQGLRGGLVRVNQRRASEPLIIGDLVEAVDPEDDMTFIGTVERLDDEGRFAYLRMDWEDDPGEPVISRVSTILALGDLFSDAEDDFEPFMLGAQVEPCRSYRLLESVLVDFKAHKSFTRSLFAGSHDDEDESTGLYRRVMLAR